MTGLVVAATELEMKALRPAARLWALAHQEVCSLQECISGVGILATASELGYAVATIQPDFIVQAGIAGSFLPDLPLGSLVAVSADRVADALVFEQEHPVWLEDLNFEEPSFSWRHQWLLNPLAQSFVEDFPELSASAHSAVTVNEISTNRARIELYQKKWNPAIESMEGACAHYIAKRHRIPFLQIRAVSNQVGDRNKNNWTFTACFEQLSIALPHVLQFFLKHKSS